MRYNARFVRINSTISQKLVNETSWKLALEVKKLLGQTMKIFDRPSKVVGKTYQRISHEIDGIPRDFYIVKIKGVFYPYHIFEINLLHREIFKKEKFPIGHVRQLTHHLAVSQFLDSRLNYNRNSDDTFAPRMVGKKQFIEAWGKYFIASDGDVYHYKEIQFSNKSWHIRDWFNDL